MKKEAKAALQRKRPAGDITDTDEEPDGDSCTGVPPSQLQTGDGGEKQGKIFRRKVDAEKHAVMLRAKMLAAEFEEKVVEKERSRKNICAKPNPEGKACKRGEKQPHERTMNKREAEGSIRLAPGITWQPRPWGKENQAPKIQVNAWIATPTCKKKTRKFTTINVSDYRKAADAIAAAYEKKAHMIANPAQYIREKKKRSDIRYKNVGRWPAGGKAMVKHNKKTK